MILKFIRTFFSSRKALKEVEQREEALQEAVAIHRVDIDRVMRRLNIQVIMDSIQDRNTLLIFEPRCRMVRLHPSIELTERRLALAMLLMHFSLTHPGTDICALKPYFVYRTDLYDPEGPENNEQWMEYNYALDYICPFDTYQAVASGFPKAIQNYAIMRVLEIDFHTLQTRNQQFIAQATSGPPAPIQHSPANPSRSVT